MPKDESDNILPFPPKHDPVPVRAGGQPPKLINIPPTNTPAPMDIGPSLYGKSLVEMMRESNATLNEQFRRSLDEIEHRPSPRWRIVLADWWAGAQFRLAVMLMCGGMGFTFVTVMAGPSPFGWPPEGWIIFMSWVTLGVAYIIGQDR